MSAKQDEQQKDKKELVQVVLQPGQFNLDSYIQNYTGHTKIDRLVFIAERCKLLEADAFRMALEEIKKSSCSLKYQVVTEKIAKKLGDASVFDQNWIDSVEKRAAQVKEKLEFDLNTAKTQLIRENIRTSNNELGAFYYSRGDLNGALKCYLRSRDYCSNPKEILDTCLNIIKVSIEMGNYIQVSNYVTKAEQTSDIDKVTQAKLKVCSGLTNLAGKKYKQATRFFLETPIDLGLSFNDVITLQDVGIYAGLGALATYDRQELKKKVIDNPSFRSLLELNPEIKEMIQEFYSSQYASCLQRLDKLKPILLLDMHLSEHMEGLYQKIREKAMIQYFSPFLSVDLNAMATAFNTSVGALEKELSKLIMEDLIQARIDSHNKRLYARQTDPRTSTFQKSLQTGDEFLQHTSAALFRMSLLRHDFTVKPKRDREDRGAGGDRMRDR